MNRDKNADLHKIATELLSGLVLGKNGAAVTRPFWQLASFHDALEIVEIYPPGYSDDGQRAEYEYDQIEYGKSLIGKDLIRYIREQWNRWVPINPEG